jgi:hypothetical protein
MKRFKEERLMPLQEKGCHVIESELLNDVNYVIKGDAIAIVTYKNGVITMSLEAFRTLAIEALEVFDFWEGANDSI